VLVLPSEKLLGVNGRLMGAPAKKEDVELDLVIGITRVVHDKVVPLHAEVVTNAVGLGGAELLDTWKVIEVVGYTGIEGLKPPLQFGGVQEAVTADFPAAEPTTAPVEPNTELDPGVTATDCGEEDVQTSGMPVRVIPSVSFTTASTAAVGPPCKTREEDDPGASCKEMDCTGQVVNCTGGEVTPATVAKMEVVPGTVATAIC